MLFNELEVDREGSEGRGKEGIQRDCSLPPVVNPGMLEANVGACAVPLEGEVKPPELLPRELNIKELLGPRSLVQVCPGQGRILCSQEMSLQRTSSSLFKTVASSIDVKTFA